jgi:hypothetical protein
MSDLLNKYTELHEQLIDQLLEYHRVNLDFLERQSPNRTLELRRVLKKIRLTIKEMENTAQARKQERQIEWGATHRLPKEK